MYKTVIRPTEYLNSTKHLILGTSLICRSTSCVTSDTTKHRHACQPRLKWMSVCRQRHKSFCIQITENFLLAGTQWHVVSTSILFHASSFHLRFFFFWAVNTLFVTLQISCIMPLFSGLISYALFISVANYKLQLPFVSLRALKHILKPETRSLFLSESKSFFVNARTACFQ